MKCILRFLAILLFFISCNSKTELKETEKENVKPKGTFWVGNADSGNWFRIEEIHAHKNNARVSIYDGRSGKEIVSKKFTLVCPIENQVFIQNLESEIESYNGVKIYLKSGCWLQ